MKRTHLIFCSIWFVTACVFGVLAYESYQAMDTGLFRFSSDVPNWGSVEILGVDLGATLNKMSETNNKNVGMLEASIRRSAILTLVLNAVSCSMAIFGFIAQIIDYRHKNSQGDRKQEDIAVANDS